jgi:hypothetical protein
VATVHILEGVALAPTLMSVLLGKDWRVHVRMLWLVASEVARRLGQLCIQFWRGTVYIRGLSSSKITYGNKSTYSTNARSFRAADF